ncbi:hypothetical protein D3C71_1230540 [compost metagenome]
MRVPGAKAVHPSKIRQMKRGLVRARIRGTEIHRGNCLMWPGQVSLPALPNRGKGTSERMRPGSLLCRAAAQLAVASGNVVFFDKHGKPTAVPANSPIIQATPDPRDGTFHYTISASVAEGLAIDSGGGALSGIGV